MEMSRQEFDLLSSWDQKNYTRMGIRVIEEPEKPEEPEPPAGTIWRETFVEKTAAEKLAYVCAGGRVADKPAPPVERPPLAADRKYRDEWQALDAKERMAFIRSGGRIAD